MNKVVYSVGMSSKYQRTVLGNVGYWQERQFIVELLPNGMQDLSIRGDYMFRFPNGDLFVMYTLMGHQESMVLRKTSVLQDTFVIDVIPYNELTDEQKNDMALFYNAAMIMKQSHVI